MRGRAIAMVPTRQRSARGRGMRGTLRFLEMRTSLISALGLILLALWVAGCAADPDRCGAHAHANSSAPAAEAKCSFRF